MQVITSGVRERGNSFREENFQDNPCKNQVSGLDSEISERRKPCRPSDQKAGGPGAYTEFGKRVGL